LRVAIAVNNVAALTTTWTTIHLIDAFLDAGHEVRVIESLEIDITPAGEQIARAWRLDPPSPGIEQVTRMLQRRTARRARCTIASCDLLLLRVNPLRPELLTFGLLAEDQGVRVVNAPAGLARTSSKSWLATLADVPRPKTLITRSRATAHQFARELRKTMILKPMTGSGGRGVHRLPPHRPDLLDRALDQLYYTGHFVIQEYLPEADKGEKRLVWANGEVIGAYMRQRTAGEFRHNLKQGSAPHPCEISDTDQALAAAVGPHLMRNGIRIAGMDVIGDRLIEVNTLNPGGVHYAELLRREPGQRLATRIVEQLTQADRSHSDLVQQEGTSTWQDGDAPAPASTQTNAPVSPAP
jgi:glutathione synthase